MLSPDLFRAYDRVWMHPKDAQSIGTDAGQSTYNEWEAENLAAIRQVNNLLVVKEHPAHVVPSEKEVEKTAYELLELPDQTKRPAALSLPKLKSAVIHGHCWWISYNQAKLALLRRDEEYALLLKKDLLPNWQSRVVRLSKCPPRELARLIREDEEIRSTYVRLVAATLRMVNGADKGIDVFDHMLAEYLPMITYYEHYRLARDNPCNLERNADQVQVVARWTKMRKGAGMKFDELETLLQRFEYADTDIAMLRQELLNLDLLLKEFKTLRVEAQWINDWCRRASKVLYRVEQRFKAVRYSKWMMAVFGFFGVLLPIGIGATIGSATEAILLVSEAPGIESRIKRFLTRLALAVHGMPGSSGRYILLASNSIRSLGHILERRDYVRKQASRHAIEDHFWPYVRRLEGSESAHKVVP